MFCSNCGTNIAEGNAFCPNCGTPVNAQQTAQPAAPAQQAQTQQPAYTAPAAQAPAGVPGVGLGIASMVIGIVTLLSFCIWWLSLILGILAIAFGAIGLNKAKVAGGKNAFAVTGLVCGCVGIGLMVIIYILAILTVFDFVRMFSL